MTGLYQVICEHLTSMVRFLCLEVHVFVYTMASTHRLMTSFGAQLQTQPSIPTQQKSLAMRGAKSVSITICKHCILDFISDYKDF